jgi:TRAP-type C4-dicarboxylate transport system permease large subunit
VTLASFLLGGPSGSGVATTVTLGSVAAPMLAKVGYSKEEAGGCSPPGGWARSSRPRCSERRRS